MTVTYTDGASVPSCNKASADLGTAITIYTNRPSTAATHTLTYSFAGTTGTIATGINTALSWTPPLSLAARLKAAGVPILGTTPESIDLAENRELFGEVLKKADMNAPRYGTALSLANAASVSLRTCISTL